MTCLTCVYYEASCRYCGCHGKEMGFGDHCEFYNRKDTEMGCKIKKKDAKKIKKIKK